MADDVEQVSDWRVPPVAVRRVDGMIERALRDLDELVSLRAELIGEDPFGDRQRQEEAMAELERRVAEADARDPQGAAASRAWVRELRERIVHERGEVDAGPPSAVRLATDAVRRWRQMQRDQTAAVQALVRRTVAPCGDGTPPGGSDDA